MSKVKVRLFTRLQKLAGKVNVFVPSKGNPGTYVADVLDYLSRAEKGFREAVFDGDRLAPYVWITVNGAVANVYTEIPPSSDVWIIYPAEGGT